MNDSEQTPGAWPFTCPPQSSGATLLALTQAFSGARDPDLSGPTRMRVPCTRDYLTLFQGHLSLMLPNRVFHKDQTLPDFTIKVQEKQSQPLRGGEGAGGGWNRSCTRRAALDQKSTSSGSSVPPGDKKGFLPLLLSSTLLNMPRSPCVVKVVCHRKYAFRIYYHLCLFSAV
jgi:hypothetical protein